MYPLKLHLGDIFFELRVLDFDVLTVGNNLVSLTVTTAVYPSHRLTVDGFHLKIGLLGWTLLYHLSHLHKLLINLLEVTIVHLIVGQQLPEDLRQIQCDMCSCPQTASH